MTRLSHVNSIKRTNNLTMKIQPRYSFKWKKKTLHTSSFPPGLPVQVTRCVGPLYVHVGLCVHIIAVSREHQLR